jgi:glycosyltransferase involved in cell wall biosynthesis
MRTCVIIPTYNEAKAIGRIVKEVKLQNLDVLVIDDGSTDETSKIAKENGAVILRNDINQGKGSSLIEGFNYAVGLNFDAVVTMDGDGQHLPQDLPYFIRLAEYSDSSIIIGNRMKSSKNMPLTRLLTNRFMSWLISNLANQKIPDSQCGFRLIKKEVLTAVNLITSRYETESEILLRCSQLGLKIESVPIKTVYRDEKSRINPLIDTVRFFKLIIKEYGLRCFKKKNG